MFFNFFSNLNACKTIKLPYIIKRDSESHLTTWFRIDKSRSYLTPCTNDRFTFDTCIRKIMLLKLNYINSHRKVLENLINYKINISSSCFSALWLEFHQVKITHASSSLLKVNNFLGECPSLTIVQFFNKCPDVLLWYFMQGLMGHLWVCQQNKISLLHV